MKGAANLILILALSLLLRAQQASSIPPEHLGPHSIGGRGCPACHVPHGSVSEISVEIETELGAKASIASSPGQPVDACEGPPLYQDQALLQAIPGYEQQDDEVRGIVICLSCHDGTIAKETMLRALPFDERAGLRQFGNKSATRNGTTAFGYSTFYENGKNLSLDHSVGPFATLGAVYPNIKGITLATGASGIIQRILFASDTPEAYFAANYGFVSLLKGKWGHPRSNAAGALDPAQLSVLCTTCHNPHGSSGTHTSYYFLNGPYNPNAKFDPRTQAPSTTQFCRQCHFEMSNEYNGQNHIATAF